MPQTVIISYRGANYAIGQGQLYYGIWPAASPDGNPIEWWQHTPEGWSAAWARFTAVEVPGTIAPVTAPAAGPPAAAPAPALSAPALSAPALTDPEVSGPAAVAVSPPAAAAVTGRSRIGAGLLALGVILGIIGIFPVYVDGASLASTAADLVPHLIYLAAWTLTAVLILTGGARRQAGALIGAGTTVVTFGLFVADAGTPISGGSHLMGAGLVLSFLGWAACAAGVAVVLPGLALRQAMARRGTTAAGAAGYGPGAPAAYAPGGYGSAPSGYGSAPRRARRFSSHEIVPMVTLMLAALGAAIAFAPSWDSFTLHTTAGATQTLTEGNAFTNPGAVIAGDVLVMVGFFAVIVVAALWRPTRLGAALAAGALIPLVAQAISALVQIASPASPLQFGISQAQASAAGLTISSGLTAMFWVYCAFLVTIIMLGVWMVLAPPQAPARQADNYSPFGTQPGWAGPAGPAPAATGTPAPANVAAASTGTVPAGQPAPAGQSEPPTASLSAPTEIIPGLRPAP